MIYQILQKNIKLKDTMLGALMVLMFFLKFLQKEFLIRNILY